MECSSGTPRRTESHHLYCSTFFRFFFLESSETHFDLVASKIGANKTVWRSPPPGPVRFCIESP